MAELLHERKGNVLGFEGLTSDEEIRLRNDLGKFTIALIKAILQTSFYRTEHKLTVKAVDDFFTCMEPLQEFFRELTYVSSADETKPDFSVEGIMVEPIPLSACIKAVLRDEFLNKLRDFFQWNKLVSFSVKRELDREQFLTFLHISARDIERILKEKKDSDEGKWDKLKHRPITDQLLESGVISISAVCRDDMVFIDRKLPWRVKLALTRLMKNLRDIPLYSKASKQRISEAKAQLLKEIIRPLRGRDMLMELLLNCDLVYETNEELRDMDIEADILIVLNRSQLQAVSERFVEDLEQNPDSNATEKDRKQKGLSLVRKCLLPLSDVLDNESLDIFRRAVKGGFLSMMELPENVQQFIRVERMADDFLDHPDETMDRYKLVEDVASFRANASNAAMLVRELVFRKEYLWASNIVELIYSLSLKHRDPKDRLKQLLEDSLEAMSAKQNFERMLVGMGGLTPEQQTNAFKLCNRFRDRAMPMLVQELRKDIKDEVRAGIRAVLAEMGQQGISTVHAALEIAKQRWEFYKDLLLVTAEIKDESSFELANQFLGNEEPEVRVAAFTAVTAIGGRKSEVELMRGLRDPDPVVRRNVVEALGKVGCRTEAFMQFLKELFEDKLRPNAFDELTAIFTRKIDQLWLPYLLLLNSGAMALHGLLKKGGVSRAVFEHNLIRMLRLHLNVTLFKGGEGVRAERQKLLLNMIGVLQQIGAEQSLPVLISARERGAQVVSDLAATSIRDIKRRENITYKERWYHRVARFLREVFKIS